MAGVRTVLFGDLLKRYRVAEGLTQEELAERLPTLSISPTATEPYWRQRPAISERLCWLLRRSGGVRTGLQ
jgi:transcriptional regulator with XRE-family HTH domain